MRKFILVSVAVLVASTAIVALADLPESITIDACADAKAPVVFPHSAHVEVTDCVTCHHTKEGLTVENYAEKEVQSCGAGHIEPEPRRPPQK